ncbi:hypothetical protein BD770DRAFT_380444 [Pilaira anomala]|nr:hypothetical protein BD770DRAFT_380444 [Pilaira anomala]
MSGGSAALDTIIPNILSGPISTSPSYYMWNIPLDVATMPSYSLAMTGDNGAATYSSYFTIMAAAPGATTNYTAAAPAASPAASGAASGQASAPGAATSGTAANGAAANNAADKDSSAATSLKAGLFGAGIAGAVALLI